MHFSLLNRLSFQEKINLQKLALYKRGAAHVGMIKAMIEANIPIDMIGGTSIGSFMGALWAEESDFEKFCHRAREWSKVSGFSLF